ncbi:putative DNA primase [Sphingobacterium sp. PM2-P1-29]|nr:putative DNA primase [Sphingobacterium sp. PM2-P1-29]
MNTSDINKLSIIDFLSSIGYFPERKHNGYWLYKSFINPQQQTGSLKISSNNLWVDYSDNNRGGTLIDLILLIYPGLSVSDIVRNFNQGVFSFHQLTTASNNCEESASEPFTLLKEDMITNHESLCQYLVAERGIDIKIAMRYLKAYQYRVKGKTYWNLGIRNHLGGYNLFSKGFKCATQQGVTLFTNSKVQSRIYFEGILDFLSFLMIYPDQENCNDYCILNSVNNLKKTLEVHPLKQSSIAFFDRDKAGDRATDLLRAEALNQKSKFYDYRTTFQGKDLNDYLLGNY